MTSLPPVPVQDDEANGALTDGAAAGSWSGITAAKGVALGVVGLVVMGGGPKRRVKRAWRRKVRGQGDGRAKVRKDKRPYILGPELDPSWNRKEFSYYCNKMFKVIRESSAVDMAPSSTDSEVDDLDPQKAIVRPLNEAAEFVTPAVWNRPLFRVVALAAGGGLAGTLFPGVGMIHLSAFGIWLGTNVWTTFIAGLTMFKNLPRKQFGSLQAKLFPKYFQLGTLCTIVMLISGYRLRVPIGPAIFTLVCTLANLLYLEPKATEVMFERYDGSADAARSKELKSQFNKLHGMSSLANLLALVGLVAHGAAIAALI